MAFVPVIVTCFTAILSATALPAADTILSEVAATTGKGEFATEMGHNTKAEGSASTAMGHSTIAKGRASTAMGWNTIAKGHASTAMGHNTNAEGHDSTAMGKGITATRAAGLAVSGRVTSETMLLAADQRLVRDVKAANTTKMLMQLQRLNVVQHAPSYNHCLHTGIDPEEGRKDRKPGLLAHEVEAHIPKAVSSASSLRLLQQHASKVISMHAATDPVLGKLVWIEGLFASLHDRNDMYSDCLGLEQGRGAGAG